MSIKHSSVDVHCQGTPDWENESIKYVDIKRKGENNNTAEEYIEEPKLWKKDLEITKRIKWKGLQRDVTVHTNKHSAQESMRNTNVDLVHDSNRKEYEARRFKQKLATEICNVLWNKLNYERQTAFDLFDSKCYVHFTKKEKSQFYKKVLSYFIAHATDNDTLKERLIRETVRLEDKDKSNLNELRRIANEHNLCLILHCETKSLLGEKKPMLITSKSFFFNIIGTIIRNESFELINKGPSIVRFLLKLCEPSDSLLRQNQLITNQSTSLARNLSKMNPETTKYKPSIRNANKVSCSIKQYLEEEKSNAFGANHIKEVHLQKEDYEVIERETLINDLIHKSILKIANKEQPEKELWEQLREELLQKKKRKKKNGFTESKKDFQDPVQLLKRFLEKDSNILDYKDFLDELRSCTFQPNVHRFIEKEKIRQKNLEEKGNENSIPSNPILRQNETKYESSEENDIFHFFNNTYKEIDKIKMNEYLNVFDTYYNNESVPSTKNSKGLLENPKHRTQRNEFRSVNNINFNSIIVKKKKNPIQMHSKKNEWMNELRGGYICNHFNYSYEDENEMQDEKKKKKNKLKQVDWGKKIRLANRRLQTKVIPNIKLVKKLIEIDTSSQSYKEEPTTMFVRSKCTSRNNSSEKPKDTKLGPKPGSLLSSKNASKEKGTTFLVPTPMKMHNYNRKIRIQNELRSFGQLTTFAPPKIIAVESETILEDIRKELYALPDSVHMLTKYKHKTTT